MNGLHRSRTVLFLRASMAGLALALALPAAASVTTLTPATQMRTSDQVLGPLAQSKPIHVVVSLKLRNQAKLNAFLAQPNHGVLTPAQFEQAYSPTPAQAAAVVTFLQQSGFTNVTVAPNRMLVSADAPAGTVQAAFHTQLVSVRTHTGRSAFANATPVQIPASLQTTVRAVLGLQTVYELHSFAQPVPQNSLQTLAVTGHSPTDFPAIYGASTAPVASGVTVGIISAGDMSQVLTDLSTFATNNGMTYTAQVINVGTAGTGTTGVTEWDLDSQDILAMAGGSVSKILFYTATSMTEADLATDINKAVSDNLAKIINISLGECEISANTDGTAATNDASFQQAVAQGQTFSVAAGDSGAPECPSLSATAPDPSWPASSRYVVAVGGTTLDASTTTWNAETVWNDSSTSATGGSPSTFEPMPSWQVGVGQNAGSSYRGVPDIAYDGDPNSGAYIIVNGSTMQVGGTSLAAPLFAGAWARVIQAKGTSVGFAAPLLYQMAAVSASKHFHDITSGNNNGETAATGWDYCSGWGSMMIDSALTPTALNGSIAALENVSANGTLNGTDWDGDTLTYAVATPPSHGSVSITNTSTGAFSYTPTTGYYGKDSFTFQATDPGGLVSNAATETVNVDAIPVATSGSLNNDVSGLAITGQLKGSDPDGDTKLTYAIASQPSHGTVGVNSATGAVTYTSAKGYTGSDSFTFTVTDSVGQVSPAGTEQVNVVAAPLPLTSSGSSGGGGAFGLWGLLGLALLARCAKALKGADA